VFIIYLIFYIPEFIENSGYSSGAVLKVPRVSAIRETQTNGDGMMDLRTRRQRHEDRPAGAVLPGLDKLLCAGAGRGVRASKPRKTAFSRQQRYSLQGARHFGKLPFRYSGALESLLHEHMFLAQSTRSVNLDVRRRRRDDELEFAR
jgi:hypothetical protein